MSLLSRHVSELKSEEFVLGVSTGFKGEAGSRFEGLESTKLVIVAAPSSKNWTGFTAVEQSIGDASAVPGARIDSFLAATKAGGAQPMVTIPMVGQVAKVGGQLEAAAIVEVKQGLQGIVREVAELLPPG